MYRLSRLGTFGGKTTSAALALLGVLGCPLTTTLGSIAQNAPPARVPILVGFKGGSPYVPVTVDANGYQALPTSSVRLQLQLPFPSNLHVDMDGTAMQEASDQADAANRGLGPTGFYLTSAGPTMIAGTSDASWTIDAYLPQAKRNAETSADVAIRVESLNPSYSGTDKLSDPLAMHLYPVAAPTNVTASLGMTFINLRWIEHRTKEVFVVERHRGPSDPFVWVAQTDTDMVTYSDAPPTNYDTYCYHVRAIVASGVASLYSSEACGNSRPLGP